MFDVSWTEILVVAVIAIIVVGPKELPGMLRAFGKTFGQVRRTAREFQSTFNDALREAERQANLDDVRKDIDSVRGMDPTKALRKGLDDTKKSLSGKIDPGSPSANTAAKPAVAPAKAAEAAAEKALDPAETPAAGAEGAPSGVVPLKNADTAPHSAADTPAGANEAPRAVAGGDR